MMTALCYVLNKTLIDTGPSHNRKEVLDMVRRHAPGQVLLTHYHEDHSGNAAAIRESLGIKVYGHALTAQKLSSRYKIFPYQHLMWGPTTPLPIEPLEGDIEDGNLKFEAIHTPGHSKDHLCYLVASEGWLFSGDLYLSSQIKYFRADERIEDQLRSLRLVMKLDFDALFCAHHPRAAKGKTFIAAKLQYLEDLYGSVAELAKKGLDASAIMRELKLREDRKIKWLCFGNVSMKNLVNSVIKAEQGSGLSGSLCL
jgi:glyoxylase-like metal-dependent hydrolase (beta-lactamase superfamily II)